MQKEEWRPVVGFEGYYEVSDLGRVRSCDRWIEVRATAGLRRSFIPGAPMRTAVGNHGYPSLRISKEGFSLAATVHRLVCEAFHGPQPVGKEVAHQDGDRANARADNLRWATISENSFDRFIHGTGNRGESNPNSQLSEEQVREIRGSAKCAKHFATKFGVSVWIIYKVRDGTRWGSFL